MSGKDITSYLKHNGFFLPNAEIYGGLAKGWDLGPAATELKKNLKNLWWKYFITGSPYNVGCDSLILTHPRVLEVSGHLKNFHDWLVECLNCQKRYRLDNLLSPAEFASFLEQKPLNYQLEKNCPGCQKKKFTPPRQFNLLLNTNLEKVENQTNLVYLRPETCQGIFVNFLAVQQSTHRKLPFGIGQIGKSFRNEITLHHGIFRTREFEQMELEFFCEVSEREKWWNYWVAKAWDFYQKIVPNSNKIKSVELKKDELPHYAQKTTDFYFNYHFGWGEVCSLSDRGTYDLSQHNLSLNGIIPEVVEVSFGVERLMLAILENSYQKEKVKDKGEREFLKLPPLLAPYFVAVIPLPAGEKKLEIQAQASQIYTELLKVSSFAAIYEATHNIGKNYRRQDAIGTYYCLTVDTLTVNEYLSNGEPNPNYNTITLRQRDSMEQERIKIKDIKNYLYSKYEALFSRFTQEKK